MYDKRSSYSEKITAVPTLTLLRHATEWMDHLDERKVVLLAELLGVVTAQNGDHRRERVLYELLRRLATLSHRAKRI